MMSIPSCQIDFYMIFYKIHLERAAFLKIFMHQIV